MPDRHDPGDLSDRLLVYCAGVEWDAVQGTDKHLALQLARSVRVLWVDPPLSVVTPARARALRRTVREPRLSRVAPGLTRLTTLAPPYPNRAGVERVTSALVARSVRRAVDRLGDDVLAMLVSSPEPRFAALPDVAHVYYATDDFVAGATLMRMSEDRLRAAEQHQVRGADALVAISPEILGRWDAHGRPAVVLPNGCDPQSYAGVDDAPLPDDVTLPGPIAGVVGQLSARLDLGLLEAVADAGISLLLVGPLEAGFAPRRMAELLARPGVQWVGPKPFAALPSYLRVIDVGLTPYADTPFNRASFPLKTLEYLAAGRGSVATPLPAIERLGTGWVSTAATRAEFVAATQALLDLPRTRALHDARRAFASRHSWATRAADLLGILADAEAARRAGGPGTRPGNATRVRSAWR